MSGVITRLLQSATSVVSFSISGSGFALLSAFSPAFFAAQSAIDFWYASVAFLPQSRSWSLQAQRSVLYFFIISIASAPPPFFLQPKAARDVTARNAIAIFFIDISDWSRVRSVVMHPARSAKQTNMNFDE